MFPKGTYSISWDIERLMESLLFFPGGNGPLLSVGWTLIFEMFFYSSLSIFLAVNKRHSLLLCSLFLILLPLLVTNENFLGNHNVGNNFYLYEFVAGIAIYFVTTNKKYQFPHFYLSLIMITMLIVNYMNFGNNWPTKIFFSSAVVVTFLSMEPLFQKKNVIMSFFRKIGDLSYSTYLCHSIFLGWFVFIFGNTFSLLEEVGVIIIISVSIYLISWLSFTFIETGIFPNKLKAGIIQLFTKYRDRKATFMNE